MRILFRPQVILVAVIAGVAALGSSPALATHTGESTVNATVTPAVLSVTVTPSTVDYDVVELTSTDNLPTPTFFTATNNGSITEDIQIRGADTADWTLVSGVPGTDEYRHEASKDGFTTPIILTTSNTLLAAGVTTGSPDVTVSLRLDAPSDTTTTAQQTAPVTVVAVAP